RKQCRSWPRCCAAAIPVSPLTPSVGCERSIRPNREPSCGMRLVLPPESSLQFRQRAGARRRLRRLLAQPQRNGQDKPGKANAKEVDADPQREVTGNAARTAARRGLSGRIERADG